MPKYVYDFSEGNKDLKDLLGGKGANLAEMTNLGLPVPPGFTITTEACTTFLTTGSEPAELADEVTAHLEAMEKAIGRRLGDPDDPLLVSVRSGAKFSMPGMMETVLNIGLNDSSVQGLARQSGNERFAWDSYRRLIQMFGKTVLDIDGEHFEDAIDEAKKAKGTRNDLDLDASDLQKLVETFKGVVREHGGREFPQEPREQMNLAIQAVFNSWNADRAILYRRQERIPADLGTAVNVQSMVFGNTGMDSGTGVAFTRDPATGAQGIYGDYLQNAQGEDVVAGIRNTLSLHDLERIDKPAYDQLMEIMATLEGHYKDLCDIEFTIENEKLWMLQTRVGKRTAAAAFVIAAQFVDEGQIDLSEALQRVTGAQLAQLMFPTFDEKVDKEQIAKGMNASPGAAVGKVVFDSHRAADEAAKGEKVILVRRETTPDDLVGMIAAQGILTSRGGKTSHAAVVARGMGKTCVCGAEELEVDLRGRKFTAPGGVVVNEGDVVSIDGTTGKVYLGEVPVQASPVVQYFEGTLAPDSDQLVAAVHRLIGHADEVRRLGVRANSDNPEDSERARRFGAAGHRPVPDRAHVPRRPAPAGRGPDPGRVRRRAAGGAGRAGAAAEGGLRRDLHGDGRPARHRAADRPAAARVPARPHRAVGEGRGGRGQGRGPGPGQDAAGGGAAAARGQPDARPARRPARPGHPGPVRHAGQGHRRGRGRAEEGRRRPEAGDHDPAGRRGAGAGDHQGRDRAGARRRRPRSRRRGATR